MKGLLLLVIPVLMLLFGGALSSQAQTAPTPNAQVSALQTQRAQQSDDLARLKQDQANAQATLNASRSNLNDVNGQVTGTQNNINQTDAKINAGLGQQALDAIGPLQSQVSDLQGRVQGALRSNQNAEQTAGQFMSRAQTVVPAALATSDAAVRQAAGIAPTVQAQGEAQLYQQSERYQSERTTERVLFGVALVAALVGCYHLARARQTSTPGAPPAGQGAAPEPIGDRDRLPSQPVEFVEDEGLGEYFSQSDHPQ